MRVLNLLEYSKDADEIVETVECSELWRRSEADDKALGKVPCNGHVAT